MKLARLIAPVFEELADALQQLTDVQYTHKCRSLSGATIGQHVRHSIELFQCLQNGYETGVVNYEKRKRDLALETDKRMAIALLQRVAGEPGRENRDMKMEAAFGTDNGLWIHTNYYRELAYNLEHTIHHMALIRVGIIEIADIVLPESFGVAPSTIQYRKACAP